MCDFISNASYLGQLTLVMSTFVCMIMMVEEAIFGKCALRSFNVIQAYRN